MKYKVQGTILSKVACYNERQVHANSKGLDVNQVPLRYGSLRMAVNLIQLNDINYGIDKTSSEDYIKETRLILEISYKYNSDGNIIEDHDIINELITGSSYDLNMDAAFVRKNHYLKFINASTDQTIKSYFIKAWADSIAFVDLPTLKASDKTITPKQVTQTMCLDKSLVIA